jgi:biotin-(acetyl-CoA carboxylase) ligase
LYGLNQTLKFRSKGVVFEGIITGTDEFGRLMVKTANEEKKFMAKEIEFLGLSSR